MAYRGLYYNIRTSLTCQYGATFPLVLDVAVGRAGLRKRRLKHERIDVVVLLEIILPILQFVFAKVRSHVCDL